VILHCGDEGDVLEVPAVCIDMPGSRVPGSSKAGSDRSELGPLRRGVQLEAKTSLYA
jgi:hypothetical protein